MEANKLKNYILGKLDKGYPFKPKNVDYITSDESKFIVGLASCRDQIFNIIDEYYKENGRH